MHVDKNEYYGGIDAGLSLDQAQKWTVSVDGQLDRKEEVGLGPSRAYTISLKPQIIYAKSRFLPSLVSSQIHTQLEFQAVGSFWLYTNGKLQKIPSNREDVFADETLSARDKRRLMGILRYVMEEREETASESGDANLAERLQGQFKIPASLQPPIQALTLGTDTIARINFDLAMSRLKRHLISMGYFGPGLAAVMAKYGGNAEIAQVACRAGAVSGFVYLLGQALISATLPAGTEAIMQVELSDGTKVKTKHLVGMQHDLPPNLPVQPKTKISETPWQKVAHRISIISKPLQQLFVSASENGPVPAVSIALVNGGVASQAPVYLQVHSADTGECPQGQCIVYGSVVCVDEESASNRLTEAIDQLISTSTEEDLPKVLWSVAYMLDEPLPGTSLSANLSAAAESSGKLFVLPPRKHDLAFDDSVLEDVKVVWEAILGETSKEYDFLRFEGRNDEDGE